MAQVIEIGAWSEFVSLVSGDDYRSWAFRGYADARWQVYSTLSRAFMTARVDPRAWQDQECRALRIFQRKAHLFLAQVPPHDDAFHWLSIMQHHGAPTRLVDFTWSPYVAAFFALERATQDAAVLAVCPPRLQASVSAVMPPIREHRREGYDFRGTGNYERYFQVNRYPMVFQGEPYVLNQRLIAQEGTFLVPGVLHRPIESLVSELPGCADAVVKFVLKTEGIRREAMRALYNMNITHATLFPDLDGLARSMAGELELHWAYDPVTMDELPGFEPMSQYRVRSVEHGVPAGSAVHPGDRASR